MHDESKQIQLAVLKNPWRNAYWFARMFINGDKYGAIGKESKLLTEICLALRKVIDDTTQPDETKINLAKNVIKSMLDKRFIKQTTKTNRIGLFYEDLTQKLHLQKILPFSF